ncbi:hypothetical protein F441_10799 [Phytophthora nicotianae CJ01A1]|uniref:Uncharacterized protein n=2 Tax=Phytophthora nicotianae TaxID=4792 RepID=W2IWS6_PHYNI|nr:hypothetical protein L915_10609 [Phytophthora nicotianae]ETL37853.1 hypothetical protein L916_10499 [Phytophthora nicotianae]ETP14207.1 hypothetical protein F441_10799 [Phytophthora nicotianae CJ01A1]
MNDCTSDTCFAESCVGFLPTTEATLRRSGSCSANFFILLISASFIGVVFRFTLERSTVFPEAVFSLVISSFCPARIWILPMLRFFPDNFFTTARFDGLLNMDFGLRALKIPLSSLVDPPLPPVAPLRCRSSFSFTRTLPSAPVKPSMRATTKTRSRTWTHWNRMGGSRLRNDGRTSQ